MARSAWTTVRSARPMTTLPESPRTWPRRCSCSGSASAGSAPGWVCRRVRVPPGHHYGHPDRYATFERPVPAAPALARLTGFRVSRSGATHGFDLATQASVLRRLGAIAAFEESAKACAAASGTPLGWCFSLARFMTHMIRERRARDALRGAKVMCNSANQSRWGAGTLGARPMRLPRGGRGERSGRREK